MNLLNNILKWTQKLPSWQRDAARRLLQCEAGLSESDYADLYVLLKAEHGLPNPNNLTPEPLADSHLPASIQSGQTVILKEIGNLTHVNRIAPDQKILFSEKGMSVIYGDNGSGKSGYVRVMKQACRCRDQAEPVYPNANDPVVTHKTPGAKFKIEQNGKVKKIDWKHGSTPDVLLSSISVFDSRCARSYLTAEQDVAYLPYGLDVVENMARDVIPELDRRLSAEIHAIDVNTYAFNHLAGETEVGELISKLSARTNPDTVETLSALSPEDEQRAVGLGKALAEADPVSKADELKRFVSRLKYLAENVRKVTLWVNAAAVLKLKTLVDGVIDAEQAEVNAALALQSGEKLLPGTGEKLWKALFDAARKYSTEVAYPEHEFPHTGDDALCPLCQSSLDNAGSRLMRFEQYIKDDVAKTADEKRAALTKIYKKIEDADLKIVLDHELLEEIKQHDDSIARAVKDYQSSIDAMKIWMLGVLDSHKYEEAPVLSDTPYKVIRTLAAQQLREARTFIKASDVEHKKKLEKEHAELTARKNLLKSKQPVLDLISRMKNVAALTKCKSDLKTKPISDKSKEFASEAVTKELKAALDIEFYNLDVGHIKTKLKEKNVKGKIFHQLLLEIPTRRNIDEILSEGEQRAIALGSFFAELSLANHSCGIVFDDPVSSLDRWRRKHVARRLAKEAKNRQVIVFTHDTSFLGQLRDEIQEDKLDNKICYLEWKGPYAGNVCDGLPWGHSSYKERIHTLETMHKRLVDKPWPQYPNEDDAAAMLNVYNRMRATIERVIQDVVFNGVVRRYRDWINIGSLKGVVGFDNAECDEINRLYQRCNDLVDAHDPSSAKNAPVPNVTELGKDIDDLNLVVKTILDRRRTAT